MRPAWMAAAVAVAVLAACGDSQPSPSASKQPPFSPSGPSSSATSNVACDGTTDVTSTLQSAVAAGGTVTIGAGTCVLSAHITVRVPVVIRGMGSTATFLVQHSAVNIFDITADGVTVEEMNLDTATFNPGAAIKKNPKPGVLYSSANDTTVKDVTGEAGSGFGMRFVGPNPCYTFPRGGTSLTNIDMTTTGVGGFASVDVDCQNRATLSGITIHGGILALFNDENVTLTNETYTPGPLNIACAPPFYVTGPAHDITINTVLSHGGHGVVANRPNGPAYNITINNQTVTTPGC